MKNMFKLATGLFCLGIAATFTACGDSDSTSSKTEMVSCYGLTIFENDDGDDEYNESCLEAESGTKMAKIIKNACEMMKGYISEKDGEKSELGDGCSTKKKALYTCNATYNKEEYTSYHYQLDIHFGATIK